MKYIAAMIMFFCTCYAEFTDVQIKILKFEKDIEDVERIYVENMISNKEFFDKNASVLEILCKNYINNSKSIITKDLFGHGIFDLLQKYLIEKGSAYLVLGGVVYNKHYNSYQFSSSQIDACKKSISSANIHLYRAKRMFALTPEFKYSDYIERKKKQEVIQEKINSINKRLSKKITITLTQNPKNKTLTLDYAIYKICKKSKVKYLSNLSRLNCPSLKKIKLNRVVAKQKKSGYIIKLYLSASGMEYRVNSKGLYVHKK